MNHYLMISRLIKIVNKFYWHLLASPENEARHLGVNIGKNCLISTRYWSSEPYLITIGDNVQVTDNVSFHTHGGGHCIRSKCPSFDAFGKIVIKDGAYIGSWSHIMPGVIIGEGALVAAGSVVTKSVPPHTVVGGNPARFICYSDEYLDRNLQYSIGFRLEQKDAKQYLLNLPDEKFIRKEFMNTRDRD